MTYYQRGEGGEITPVGDELPEGVVRAIEIYDEKTIIQRMTTGIAAKSFIYQYPIKTATGTKEIIGISTDGADELALMTGNIEVLPDIKIDKDSDPDYIYTIVRAKNLIRNVTLLGTGRTCKFQMDKGNKPDPDRLNEWAFVSSVSKAQRNAILRLIDEEVKINIVRAWEKGGKSTQIKPPTLSVETDKPPVSYKPQPPAPAPSAVIPHVSTEQNEIDEQQEKLKKLRMEVHNRFQRDLGIGINERKEILRNKFGVESLTDMSENQLRSCLSHIEELIQKRTVAPVSLPPVAASVEKKTDEGLGFDNSDEQNRLRGRLFTMLTSPSELNLKQEEAKQFIVDRGYTSSSEIPKQNLLAIIQEVSELIKAKQTPSEF